MKLIPRIILVLFFCLGASCGKNPNPIPNVYVDFWIYPDDVMYVNLNYYGGHEEVTGGVNGIVVYRIDQNSFSAFDRACPYDWDDIDEPRVEVEKDGITLRCKKCKTMYNILDGGVISGPSKYPLKQYYTFYDGWRLRIHN